MWEDRVDRFVACRGKVTFLWAGDGRDRCF